jgi:hypothetical protein
MHRRVHQHHVRARLDSEGEGAIAVRSFADDLDAICLQMLAKAEAEEGVVIHD